MTEITAHKKDVQSSRWPEPHWEQRVQDEYGMTDTSSMSCSYCGSCTVDRAIELMQTPGVRFSGCDWKYGWPHKFTFDVPHPEPDKEFVMGSEYVKDVDGRPKYRRVMGKRAYVYVKFYTTHLSDATDEQIKKFGELSQSVFGIVWGRDKEHGVFYQAPKTTHIYGYQLWGVIDKDGKPDHSSMKR